MYCVLWEFEKNNAIYIVGKRATIVFMKVVRTEIVSYKLAEKECTYTETNNNHE
jgi:hypothetical protein